MSDSQAGSSTEPSPTCDSSTEPSPTCDSATEPSPTCDSSTEVKSEVITEALLACAEDSDVRRMREELLRFIEAGEAQSPLRSARLKSKESSSLAKQPFHCEMCAHTTATKAEMRKHLLKHNGAKPYMCNDCPYRSANSGDLSRHRRSHTGEKPYSCTYCKFKTTTASDLTKHERIHTGEKPYACTRCTYRATRASLLTLHERVHSGVRPYKCSQCEYASNSQSGLSRHVKREHFKFLDNNNIRNQGLDNILNNEEHVIEQGVSDESHDYEWPYRCSVEDCNFKAKISGDLKRHGMVHTGERPFSCDQCDYTARQKGNLTTHIKKKHPKD